MFSDSWLTRFLQLWNKNIEIVSLLKQENFSAKIGYGLVDDQSPLFVLVVNTGRLVSIRRYRDQPLDWDIRASTDDWKLLIENPPSISQLGLAYTQKRLICRQGNYSLLMKNSNLSKAFSCSFKIMHQVEAA